MPKTIEQKVKFNLAPEKLFEIYMDSKKHTQACGYKTYINPTVGGNFSLPPYHHGKFLALVPTKLIVQTWRENDWKKTDLDSILILSFSKILGGGQINLVHANLPENVSQTINRGWHKHYWKPWRVYIKENYRK